MIKYRESFFALYDFWVGAFYDRKKRLLYICPLPCCVIVFQIGEQGPGQDRPAS